MKVPSKQTLKKYGISEQEYVEMYNKYDGACHVCRKVPKNNTRALHIDHEHVHGWKDMSDNERKKYCRGLLCYTCNRFRLTRGTTLETARNMVIYLEEYEKSKEPTK